jgi:hypothetical protein
MVLKVRLATGYCWLRSVSLVSSFCSSRLVVICVGGSGLAKVEFVVADSRRCEALAAGCIITIRHLRNMRFGWGRKIGLHCLRGVC